MTARTPRYLACLIAMVVLGACRSDSADTTSSTSVGDRPIEAVDSSAAPTETQPEGDVPVTASTDQIEAVVVPTSVATTGANGTVGSTTTVVVTLPPDEDVDELVLSDGFADESDTSGESTWDVDLPGEAAVNVIDGVGVMRTDARGTHEWVRAQAPGSTHRDATLRARITPIRSEEGTVFVGLHGDGEWRDAAPYLPQTGVAVEYSYTETFLGEVVLIVLDGPEELRIGPAQGPILSDGESANIRLDVVDDLVRVKVWRAGDEEPADWALAANTVSEDGGVVQISYRDTVEQAVAWDELTLRLLS